ncbi:MAG: hypothetical protein ACPGWR_30400, partial [Ardenticatenaceae bacterium]
MTYLSCEAGQLSSEVGYLSCEAGQLSSEVGNGRLAKKNLLRQPQKKRASYAKERGENNFLIWLTRPGAAARRRA